MTKNRHGLSRSIPEKIKGFLRKEAGSGCAICGSMFIQYEHIDPPFADAIAHDESRMTVLCGGCHDKVTRGVISKETVWAAKKNPKAIQNGFLKEKLFHQTDKKSVRIVNFIINTNQIALSINSQPVIWFEESESPNDPPLLCCIFFNASGQKIAFINRNEFVAITKHVEIQTTSSRISALSDGETILLMSARGGEPIYIHRIISHVEGRTLSWIEGRSPEIKFGKSELGSIKMGLDMRNAKGNVTPIAFGLPTRILQTSQSKIATAIAITLHGKSIKSHNHEVLGWTLNETIYDINYLIAGRQLNNSAFSNSGEYAGDITSSHIEYPQNSFESGEPIFIQRQISSARNTLRSQRIDTSYKIFGINNLSSFLSLQ